LKATLLSTLLVFSVFSTQGHQISGQVINSISGEPIQSVCIELIGKSIGCFTDENGQFELAIGSASDIEIVRFSIISHQVRSFTIGDLKKRSSPIIIRLNERIIELNEVVKTGVKRSSKQMGVKRKYCYPIPLYKKASSNLPFPQSDIYEEIGVRYFNTKTIRLDSVQLNFAVCEATSVKLKLNIYTFKNGEIMSGLTEPIYLTLTKKEALAFPIIDLTAYQIDLESDFLISIENYQQMPYGSLRILATSKQKGALNPTYYRKNSTNEWTILKSSKDKIVGMSFIAYVD
jgi:hypothetical protein